jgi:hypothetical protein
MHVSWNAVLKLCLDVCWETGNLYKSIGLGEEEDHGYIMLSLRRRGESFRDRVTWIDVLGAMVIVLDCGAGAAISSISLSTSTASVSCFSTTSPVVSTARIRNYARDTPRSIFV